MSKIKFKFDPNQQHQLKAINAVVDVFEGLKPQEETPFKLNHYKDGQLLDVISNRPEYENFEDECLLENINEVKKQNKLPQTDEVDKNNGQMLEGISDNFHEYPIFTIEMETGTGKTYAYLRTIHELFKNYKFRKFIIIVPSIAIYEGVIKSFDMTKDHFKTLYGNEVVRLIRYDGSKIGDLRKFANSISIEIMVMTIDSFNRQSNVIFKPSEKLPGEKKPYEYIQATRPILILDESQNYQSLKSREALRTIKPLFAVQYSATPGEQKENLLYMLTPLEAYQLNLVKKIQVIGVSEFEDIYKEKAWVRLNSINRKNKKITADISCIKIEKGLKREATLTIKHNEDLYRRTSNDEYKGLKLEEINVSKQELHLSDGRIIGLKERKKEDNEKEQVFRVQIRETLLEHFRKQDEMMDTDIKVLSLFFIDRVANYQDKDGIIRKIFDEEFSKLKRKSSFFKKKKASDVRRAYFAIMRKQDRETAIDTDGSTKAEREIEKEAFELIMKQKEKLLSFSEEASFIFAHSALKEGWDNPNVFQICTLKDTYSERRKRQEIGRGMRLSVNQKGERIFDESINVLTVIANESYESYVKTLQTDYEETGELAPPKPTNARREESKRRDKLYRSKEFQKFWDNLNQQTDYVIHFHKEKFIQECSLSINSFIFEEPIIVIKHGKFALRKYKLILKDINKNFVDLEIKIFDTNNGEISIRKKFVVGMDISKEIKDEYSRDLLFNEIINNDKVRIGKDTIIEKDKPYEFQINTGRIIDSKKSREIKKFQKIPDFISRIENETKLTKDTIFHIFKKVKKEQLKFLIKNPECFINDSITIIRKVLADHLAENIEYTINHKLDKLVKSVHFPKSQSFPQQEVVDASDSGLYNKVQVDSDVERLFVKNNINPDEKILLSFKFPPGFKIRIPKLIGNYNPDWGIVRWSSNNEMKLHLVRETKGTTDHEKLQFPNERRKILCAKKHFKKIGVDYRVVDNETTEWWEKEQRRLL